VHAITLASMAALATATTLIAAAPEAQAGKVSFEGFPGQPKYMTGIQTWDDVPIWRLQLRFETGYTGSQDDVFVYFMRNDGDPNHPRYHEEFHLDLASAERTQYATDTYEIPLPPGIKYVHDLAGIIVAKGGDHGWSINGVEVLVNGAPLYAKPGHKFTPYYSSTLLHWLTNWKEYRLGYWDTFFARTQSPRDDALALPAQLPMEYFRGLIESTVGHYVRVWSQQRSDWSYTWKRAPVVSQVNSSTIRVSLGVDEDYHGWWATGTSFKEDVVAYVQMSCKDGDIVADVFGTLWSAPSAQIEKALYDAFLHLPCPTSMRFTNAGLALEWPAQVTADAQLGAATTSLWPWPW